MFHPRRFVASLARSKKFRGSFRKEHSSNSIVRLLSVSLFLSLHRSVETLHVGSFIVIGDGSYLYGLLQVTGSPRQFVGRAVKPETVRSRCRCDLAPFSRHVATPCRKSDFFVAQPTLASSRGNGCGDGGVVAGRRCGVPGRGTQGV